MRIESELERLLRAAEALILVEALPEDEDERLDLEDRVAGLLLRLRPYVLDLAQLPAEREAAASTVRQLERMAALLRGEAVAAEAVEADTPSASQERGEPEAQGSGSGSGSGSMCVRVLVLHGCRRCVQCVGAGLSHAQARLPQNNVI